MAYVIVDTCIDCKDASCVACCPVDCIYEGPRTFYLHPEECIDCGIWCRNDRCIMHGRR